MMSIVVILGMQPKSALQNSYKNRLVLLELGSVPSATAQHQELPVNIKTNSNIVRLKVKQTSIEIQATKEDMQTYSIYRKQKALNVWCIVIAQSRTVNHI